MKKLYLSSVLFIVAQLFFLLNPFAVQSQKDMHRAWLNLTNTEGIFKQILVGYITGATNGFDYNYDAETLDANRYADFYSINEGKKLVIQARALPFDLSDVIPLGYRSAITGNLTISIDHADGDLDNHDIYLMDKQSKTIHNLKNGSYTFYTVNGTFTERFELRFKPGLKLGLHESDAVPHDFIIFSKNGIINLESKNSPLSEVTVFDINGRLLYSRQNIDNHNLQISSIRPCAQMLLIKTSLENDGTIIKKIVF